MNFDTIELFDWIKRLPDTLINLTSSRIPCYEKLSELDIDSGNLPLSGGNLYGYPPLKEVIADRFGTSSDRIAITPGASMANFVLCTVLTKSDRRIMIETPVYQPFVSVAKAVTEIEPLRLKRKHSNNYHLLTEDLKKSIVSPVSLLMLSNLHNPSGVYDEQESINQIADIIAAQNGCVLVDEVFLPFIEGGDKQCAALQHDKIITTGSLSKVWSLSNLRVGWVIAPYEIVRRIEHTMDYMHAVQPIITEHLAWIVLSDKTMREQLLHRARTIASENWKLVYSYLNDISEFDFIQPDGGISVLVRFADGRDSLPFTDHLRKEYNTVVVPGKYFEVDDGFRISFGVDKETVREGMEAIVKALKTI